MTNYHYQRPTAGRNVAGIIWGLIRLTPLLIVGVPIFACFMMFHRTDEKFWGSYGKSKEQIYRECAPYAAASGFAQTFYPSMREIGWCQYFTDEMKKAEDDAVSRKRVAAWRAAFAKYDAEHPETAPKP